MIHPPKALATLLLMAFALLSGGCAVVYNPLQIESLKQRSAIIVPKFTESYYFFDRDQNLYFVLRGHGTDTAGKPVQQIATFRIFWRPGKSMWTPGARTSYNATSLNATYRYAVITPDAVGLYEGAGYVHLTGAAGIHKINARVLDGDIRLTQASAAFVDNVGRGRLSGDFSALYDDVQGTDKLLAAQQEFFTNSLLTKPAPTQPAPTQPAATISETPGPLP